MNERPWFGYLRTDGRKGVRNLLLVVYTVECASHVAEAVTQNEPDAHVIGFPGCYDNAYAVRVLLALARHPNVGAVLSIGLGCEYTRPSSITDAVRQSGRPAEWFYIQEEGGTRASIAHGKALLQRLRTQMASTYQLVPMTWSDLIVGAECGGSDATSGLAGNPTVGCFFDELVDAGGIAVFEETVEMIGLRHIIMARAASPSVAENLCHSYNKAEAYCKAVRQYSISPGNFVGGLTTIEEKSMGAFAKSGKRPIQGVVRVSEQPTGPGLWLLDSVPDEYFMLFGYTNPNDSEGIIDLISVGAQIVLFVTGRGSVIGSPVAPLIKITGNAHTFHTMSEDMDFDASSVLTGEVSLTQAAEQLAGLVGRVAAGEQSKPESLGHREYFVMYKHQDTPSLTQGCRA
jgi:altronate dehydratase large subunit